MSVVVPTLNRPDQLSLCLRGLRLQLRPADEILVVRRPDDEATAGFLDDLDNPAVVQVIVAKVGQVAALACGAENSTGEIVVFTDDDAIPRPEWLSELVRHYDDPSVGGAGGRDVVHHGEELEQGAKSLVGLITPYGRLIGNHHVGIGMARKVDHLKGANMSFRRAALAFPEGLRGMGAEVGNDLATSLYARDKGWKIVYDPNAIVDHYPGPRFDDDHRGLPTLLARQNSAFNTSYAIMSLCPQLRARRLVYSVLIGDRSAPGLARFFVGVCRREQGLARLVPSVSVQVEAWRTSRRQPLVMCPLGGVHK